MTIIANEIRTRNEYTSKEDVKIIIYNVPTKFGGTEQQSIAIKCNSRNNSRTRVLTKTLV